MIKVGDTFEAATLLAQLDALRASGAAERDPARFAYLTALTRRAAAQPELIRESLNIKISTIANELAARPETQPGEASGKNAASPLAELLVYISQQTREPAEATQFGTRFAPKDASAARAQQAQELKSVAYFHETWSKLSTEQQLTQTLAQAPENAGPMNSQHLVLRSLQVMRDIAPDYLQAFMSYIDTLIWLEHAAPTKLATGGSPVGERANKARTAKRGGPTNR